MYFVIYDETGAYILGVQSGGGGSHEISEAEYDAILEIVRTCPEAPEGYSYRLKADRTWELYELPVPEEEDDPEISDSEAVNIITGGEA